MPIEASRVECVYKGIVYKQYGWIFWKGLGVWRTYRERGSGPEDFSVQVPASGSGVTESFERNKWRVTSTTDRSPALRSVRTRRSAGSVPMGCHSMSVRNGGRGRHDGEFQHTKAFVVVAPPDFYFVRSPYSSRRPGNSILRQYGGNQRSRNRTRNS